jgi:hypothetical protein
MRMSPQDRVQEIAGEKKAQLVFLGILVNKLGGEVRISEKEIMEANGKMSMGFDEETREYVFKTFTQEEFEAMVAEAKKEAAASPIVVAPAAPETVQ